MRLKKMTVSLLAAAMAVTTLARMWGNAVNECEVERRQ